MTTFATQADLVVRFGSTELAQLTDRVNRPASTIDAMAVDRALTDASALASGYVGKVYSLPMAEIPPALVKATADVARYYLHGKAAEKDGEVERAFKEALSWLKDVSAGRVQLDVAGVTPPQPEGGTVQLVAPERRFTRDTQRGL